MYIEYTFGPRSGQREHVSREDANPLIRAGLAQRVEEPPAPVTPPTFGIHKTTGDVISVQYRCETCHRLMHFGGDDLSKESIDRSLCSHALARGGCPEAVVAKYHAETGKKISPEQMPGISMVQPAPFRLLNGKRF